MTDRDLLALLLDGARLTEKQWQAFSRYGSTEALFRAAEDGDEAFATAAGEKVGYLRLLFTPRGLKEQTALLARHDVRFVTADGPDYPAALANMREKPRILYYRGDLAALSPPCIAVVGTRRCTGKGRSAAQRFAEAFAAAGVTVVSGMAEGVDSAAHSGALDAGGKTVGVLGNGLDYVYPPENLSLYRRAVEEGGCLVTEFPIATRPERWNFPRRNRIIAGLSRAVVVAEAGARSGAIITAERAREQGIPVFVLPGSVMDEAAAGSNRYIAENPESLALSPEDVLKRLSLAPAPPAAAAPEPELDEDERRITAALRRGITTFEELLAATGMTSAALNEKLGMLAILGVIRRGAGNEYHI